MMLPSNPQSRGTPTYDLERIQQLVGQGLVSYRVTAAARYGAAELGLSEDELVEIVLSLTPSHFYKSMESEQLPGLWQDVYHFPHGAAVLYVKLQIDPLGRAVIIQCKEK